MTTFHPDLRSSARFIPRFSWSPRLVRAINFLGRMRGVPKPPTVEGVAIEDVILPVGAQSLRVRLYRPTAVTAAVPAMLWMHGGGFIFGTKEDKGMQIWSETFAKRGYVCVAISYSLTNHNLLLKYSPNLKRVTSGK